MAVRAFRERGVRAVSTGELAALAGISKATLYLQYPSKEALVRDVLLKVMDGVWEEGRAAAAGASGARAALKAYFAAVSARSGDYPPGVAHDLAREYPALRDELLAERARRLSRLAEVLQGAQARGELRGDLDVAAAMRVIQALVDTMTGQDFLDRAGLTPQAVPAYIGLLVDGLFSVPEGP